MARGRVALLSVVSLVVGSVVAVISTGAPSPVSAVSASEIVALSPARVLETRSGVGLETVDGLFEGTGRSGVGRVVEFEVAGRGGVDVDASAVFLNVVAARPSGAGFLTVFPCGVATPTAASLNFVAGAVVGNAVFSKVGVDGKVCVFASADTDLVVDVNGFVPARNTSPLIVSGGGGSSAAVTVSENQTVATTVLAIDTDLPAQDLTYSITGGADGGLFSIGAATGVLAFGGAPDFELPGDADGDNAYEVNISVADDGQPALTDAQAIIVSVTNVDESETQTFAEIDPTAILDNTTITSTLAVSGLDDVIADVRLQTFIEHTFASDIEMTLQSPQGTIVTITTDNGGGNDDVFDGTVWRDDAGPGGQVPVTPGSSAAVTDHTFTNLVTATPLSPEEPLAAFDGEDPNGTWTVTIRDDAVGDTGSLNGWILTLATAPEAPPVATRAFSTSTPVAVADMTVVTSTVSVAGMSDVISELTVETFLTHTFNSDVEMALESPAGTIVTLTTDNGGGNDDVFNGTTWRDDANAAGQVPFVGGNTGSVTDGTYTDLVTATPLTPEEPLSAFDGEDPNGTWTLSIYDDANGDAGQLDSWGLTVTTSRANP